MSVVAKAIALLEHFSVQTPELGLSRLYRLANRDKATTYRHLTALESLGFIEQNPVTKLYRLGPAVLHLANVREQTVPRREGAWQAIIELAEATGETAHVSVLSGTTLHTLASYESKEHSTRAVIDLQKLPLHATASGICALAFGSAELLPAAQSDMKKFTAQTANDSDVLEKSIAKARELGFCISDRTLENDICGFAAPLYDHSQRLAGTVAVAIVASRLNEALTLRIFEKLSETSTLISRNWGGTIPSSVQDLWMQALNAQTEKKMSL